MFLPICNPDSFPTHGVSRVTEGTAAFAKRLEDRALPVFGSTRAAEAPFSKAIWRKSNEKSIQEENDDGWLIICNGNGLW